MIYIPKSVPFETYFTNRNNMFKNIPIALTDLIVRTPSQVLVSNNISLLLSNLSFSPIKSEQILESYQESTKYLC